MATLMSGAGEGGKSCFKKVNMENARGISMCFQSAMVACLGTQKATETTSAPYEALYDDEHRQRPQFGIKTGKLSL